MWFLLGTTLTASFFDSLNPSAIAQQMFIFPISGVSHKGKLADGTDGAAAQRATISARLSGSFTKKWRE